MKIYLVRHGESQSNLLKIYNTVDKDLNDTGIRQAEGLIDDVDKIDYDVIISSPLVRAYHTAEIINVHHKEIIIDDRLREREAGNLVGKPHSTFDRDEFWNYNSTIHYDDEEWVPHLFDRIKYFLDELKDDDYNTVLIVAHSGVSKAFSFYFEGMGDGYFLNRGLKNCEIREYTLKK